MRCQETLVKAVVCHPHLRASQQTKVLFSIIKKGDGSQVTEYPLHGLVCGALGEGWTYTPVDSGGRVRWICCVCMVAKHHLTSGISTLVPVDLPSDEWAHQWLN